MKFQIMVVLVLVAIVAAGKGNKKGAGCKYEKGEWGTCNTATNLVSRTMTLKRGEGCEPTQTQTLSCEKYEQIKKIKDNKKAMKAEKLAYKEMIKKLKDLSRMGCKFETSVGECNQATQKVTKTFTLQSGDATKCKMDPVQMSCEMHDKYEQAMKRKEEKKSKKSKKDKKDKKRKNKDDKKSRRQG